MATRSLTSSTSRCTGSSTEPATRRASCCSAGGRAACQVGSDERVLGSYGGFASTLLRIGATGVVAPLWNIGDDVAADSAGRFYGAMYTSAEPVSVAEAMRAIRATYTEAAVRAGGPEVSATDIAFQVFGHPRLMLSPPT